MRPAAGDWAGFVVAPCAEGLPATIRPKSYWPIRLLPLLNISGFRGYRYLTLSPAGKLALINTKS